MTPRAPVRAISVTLLAGALIGALIGFGVDRVTTKNFEATAFVVTSADDVATDPSSLHQATYGVWRIPEYEAIVRSASFLARVVSERKLGLAPGELSQRIRTGTAAKRTAVLTISATDGSAVIAAALANAVAQTLTEVIGERERGVDVRATVAAGAVPPARPDAPTAVLVVLQYAVAGVVVAWIAVLPFVRRRTHRGTHTP